MRRDFLQIAKAFNPDITFMQVQADGMMEDQFLRELPGFKMTWCGDIWPDLPDFAKQPLVDAICFSNAADAKALRALGLPGHHVQIGVDTQLFSNTGRKRRSVPDVVFMANCYSTNRFPNSGLRKEAVKVLRERYAGNFAVFGNGWGNSVWLPEAEESACYRAAKIGVL